MHLVTVDRNLSFQQYLAAVRVAVIVTHAVTNRIAKLRSQMPSVAAGLPTATAGQAVHVGMYPAMEQTRPPDSGGIPEASQAPPRRKADMGRRCLNVAASPIIP